MIRSLRLLLGAATVVATVDLAYKAVSISERGGTVLAHDRPTIHVVGIAAASLFWASAIVRVRSSSIAVAAGIVVGGAVGNIASFALWPSLPGIPDPIVAWGIAFNLADVSAVFGLALLLPAILVFAARNRTQLFEPV